MVLDILHISLGREGKEGVREDRTKERRSMPKSTLKPCRPCGMVCMRPLVLGVLREVVDKGNYMGRKSRFGRFGRSSFSLCFYSFYPCAGVMKESRMYMVSSYKSSLPKVEFHLSLRSRRLCSLVQGLENRYTCSLSLAFFWSVPSFPLSLAPHTCTLRLSVGLGPYGRKGPDPRAKRERSTTLTKKSKSRN